jgi:hypothetical protein
MQFRFLVEQSLLAMVDVACIALRRQHRLITLFHEVVVVDILGRTLLAHAIVAITSKLIEH